MPPQVYLYNYDTSGYALDSTGAGYNFADLYSGGVRTVQTATVARDDPDNVYVFEDDGHTLGRSADAGLTWAIITTAPWPGGGWITDVVAHASGDLHAFQTNASGALAGSQGVWRSTNSGTSWTHLLTIPNVNQQSRGGGIAAGSSKLWYAESNTPLAGGVLPSTYGIYDIKTCNWDASSSSLHGSITLNNPSSNVTARAKLRAIDDTFCLAVGGEPSGPLASTTRKVYRITSSGSVTDITPAGLITWDVAIFNPTTYIAAGPLSDTDSTVRIYRTTNSGTSWALVQTISATEGFANRGDALTILADVVWGSTSEAYMYGYANYDSRQYVWRTIDGGQTWTSFRNGAALTDVAGDFVDFGSGGVLAVATLAPLVSIPSRIATIVG